MQGSVSTSSLSDGRSRSIAGIGTSLAIGTGTALSQNATKRHNDHWRLEAAVAGTASAVVLHREASPQVIASSELLSARGDRQPPLPSVSGSQFALCIDDGIAWWSGIGDGARAALLTADDEVHLLQPANRNEIRSEPLDSEDTLILVNRAFVDAVADLAFAIETALGGQVPPALGCAWLIELGCGDGASSPLLAAVVRQAYSD